MTSDTPTTTKAANNSLPSFLGGSKSHRSKSTGGNNLRKFFNRFPHPHQQSKSPPLSSPPQQQPYYHAFSTNTDISKCPAMSTSTSSPTISSSFASSSTTTLDFAPTQNQIDLVRTSWERVSEKRHPNDDRNISASHAFGLAFYDALFEMDPDVKPLFENVFQQARALTGMISYIARAPGVTATSSSCIRKRWLDSPPTTPTTIRDINAKKKQKMQQQEGKESMLDDDDDEYDEGDPEWLAHQMRELGARHYFYNVKPRHFELVGPAFVSALKNRLGDEYTDDIGEAWVKVSY